MPNIIVFFIILSIVVLVHELGHFFAAKKNKVKVEEFGFGYPPRVFAKKIGETVYSLNALPFGGFVRLFGEQEADLNLADKVLEKVKRRAFYQKGKKQRIAVIVAGVLMNFLLGAAAFSLVYSLIGIPEQVDYIVVNDIIAGSPAESAGLKIDTRVDAVNGRRVFNPSEFKEIIEENKGKEVVLGTLERSGDKRGWINRQEVRLTPRENQAEDEGAVGILIANYDNIFYPIWQMPFRGAWVGIKEAVAWGAMMIAGVWTIFSQLAARGTVPPVAGPIGIYQITSSVSKQGFLALVKFTGILSINLAVINILPFPALDGGRLLFVFLEKAIGRKIKPVIEQWVNFVGMVILLSLMLLVTFREAFDLVKKTSWWQNLPF